MKHMSALLLLGLLAACGPGKNGREALPEEAAQVADIAMPIAGNLAAALKQELTRAMETSGPLAAVEFCNLRALPLTAEIAANHPGISLKRVSDRLRNPKNKPDPAEEAALAWFSLKNSAEAWLPESWVQEVERGGESYYRLYKPLRMGKPCLACHGDPAVMDPALVSRLNELYPEDQARMYHEGDFRGLIRVELPATLIKD
jgi:hypothetical protein